MATGDVKRKLTAIFSADVEGYSRLMGEDELATIETLTSHKEIMRKLIRQYRGRVVDSIGDNLLAEFASVVDAVQCAVEVQQVLSSKNETLPENRRMEFRIGINLGDVVEEGESLYGDGINVAARVESLAKGGGISLSGTAYDQLGKKLPLGYEYLGEQTVKNIEKPVRIYRVLTETEAAGKVIGELKPKTRQLRGAVIGAVVILILGAAALVIWNSYFRTEFEPASVEKMAYPLPDKPSIAVLPFVNMSGDESDEYIADGLSENIISSLSKIPDMLVIARNSTFVYKDKAVKVSQVAEELGVRYVLEGSIQKSGDNLRVTAQLVDAIKGHHLWSERYDRNTKDFFAVQDDITRKIVIALQVELTEGEQARVVHDTENLEAWGYVTKAYVLMQLYTKDKNAKARKLYKQAVELDPNYAIAWVGIAWTHAIDCRYGFSESRRESFKRCVEFAQKATKLDDTLPEVHSAWNLIYLFQRQHDKAIAEGKKAVALGPSDSACHFLLALTLHFAGRFEESIFHTKEAMRLDPYYPTGHLSVLGHSYCMAGKHEKAIAALEKEIGRAKAEGGKRVNNHTRLIQALVELGRIEDAKDQAAEVLKLEPNFSLKNWQKTLFYKDPADLKRHLNALRKAGLPDKPPLQLPDKPSIAVLPFDNMSGDPEQEYFSDGIAEEIITALSKTPRLFVIARTSSFKYKGKKADVRRMGRELGVRYVLEGSVRKSENRVRITAQLIDAFKGHHLWAERYDRDLKDIFAVQDEITKKIITALQIELTEGEQALVYARGTNNLEAYVKLLKAFEYGRRQNPDDNQKAKRIVKEAIALDSNYAVAYRLLSALHMMDVWLSSSKSSRDSLQKAAELCRKAIALDNFLGTAHALLGHIHILMRDYKKGIEEGQKAVELEPNGADSHAYLGMGLTFADNPQGAIKVLKKAIRLNPMAPSWYFHSLAGAYRDMGEYDEAIKWGWKAVDRNPNNAPAHLILASCYNLAGREEEARAEAAQVLRINPKFSLERFAKTTPEKNQEVKNRLIDSLYKSGLK